MSPQKQPSRAFTSIRIIGKKAQGILARARSAGNEDSPKKKASLPQPEACDQLMVRLSIGSVVASTFAILAVIVGAWLLFHLREKIILLALAVFVATILDPGVHALQKMGIPRGMAILMQYILVILLFLFLLFSFIPIIADQLQQIAVFISYEANQFLANPEISLPLVPDELNEKLTIFVQSTLQDNAINQFTDALARFGQNLSVAAQGSLKFAAQLAGSVVNFFISFIVVLVLAFFMQLEKEKIVRWTRGFLPVRYRAYADTKSEAIHLKIGQWARGELTLMFSIALLTLVALGILRMPYALTLAVLAGFCELIPVVGPLIAAVPAVLIALTQQGFVWAAVVAGVYYIIQWCENNLLVPLIMKRAVGLSPIAILFGMMVGISFPDTIHPVLGVILAIPVTTIIAIFLEDWRSRRGE